MRPLKNMCNLFYRNHINKLQQNMEPPTHQKINLHESKLHIVHLWYNICSVGLSFEFPLYCLSSCFLLFTFFWLTAGELQNQKRRHRFSMIMNTVIKIQYSYVHIVVNDNDLGFLSITMQTLYSMKMFYSTSDMRKKENIDFLQD